jgi:hypothetical protein
MKDKIYGHKTLCLVGLGGKRLFSIGDDYNP